MHAFARSAPFAVLFCAALYFFTLTLQFEFPRAPGRLGSDIWPQAILVALMITCVIGIARDFLFPQRVEPAAEAGAPRGAALPADVPAAGPDVPSRYGLVAAGFALFLAYPVALEFLGFLVATLLMMALFMLVGQWKNPLGILAVSLAGTLVLFYIFRGIVYVSLPLGTGPFHAWTVWVAALLGMR